MPSCRRLNCRRTDEPFRGQAGLGARGAAGREANAQSDTKKKGKASKSAIGKTAKQSPTRTRVAGKRTIVAPTYNNPEKKLSEKHAEALQLAKKGKKV